MFIDRIICRRSEYLFPTGYSSNNCTTTDSDLTVVYITYNINESQIKSNKVIFWQSVSKYVTAKYAIFLGIATQNAENDNYISVY